MKVSKEIPAFCTSEIYGSFVEENDLMMIQTARITLNLNDNSRPKCFNYDEYYRKVFKCFM